MGSIRIYKGMPFTKEDWECLEKLKNMTDDDIDYSDIPPLTDEEIAKIRNARLREKNKKNIAS